MVHGLLYHKHRVSHSAAVWTVAGSLLGCAVDVGKKTILTACDSSTEILGLALESMRSNEILKSSAGVVDRQILAPKTYCMRD